MKSSRLILSVAVVLASTHLECQQTTHNAMKPATAEPRVATEISSIYPQEQIDSKFSSRFLCHQQPVAGWATLQPQQTVAIYAGTTPMRYRLAVQPAVGNPTGVSANFDSQKLPVPSVQASIDVQGKTITVKNETGVARDVCWMSAP